VQDPDEHEARLKHYANVMAKADTPEVRARMIADGVDPDAKFMEITGAFHTYLRSHEAAESAGEAALHATADAADSLYELFKGMRAAVRAHKEANPLDPRIEEWESLLEALSEQFPKDTE
jgi:hypothetical protein